MILVWFKDLLSIKTGLKMNHKYELNGTNFCIPQNSTTSNYISLLPTSQTINYFIGDILILFDPFFITK
jgi:hypothetical protein